MVFYAPVFELGTVRTCQTDIRLAGKTLRLMRPGYLWRWLSKAWHFVTTNANVNVNSQCQSNIYIAPKVEGRI